MSWLLFLSLMKHNGTHMVHVDQKQWNVALFCWGQQSSTTITTCRLDRVSSQDMNKVLVRFCSGPLLPQDGLNAEYQFHHVVHYILFSSSTFPSSSSCSSSICCCCCCCCICSSSSSYSSSVLLVVVVVLHLFFNFLASWLYEVVEVGVLRFPFICSFFKCLTLEKRFTFGGRWTSELKRMSCDLTRLSVRPSGWWWEAASCLLTCMCGTGSAWWSCPGTRPGPGGSPSWEWTSATTGSIASLTVPELTPPTQPRNKDVAGLVLLEYFHTILVLLVVVLLLICVFCPADDLRTRPLMW